MFKKLLILTLFTLFTSCTGNYQNKWVKLFNGKDLTGWQVANNHTSTPKGINGNAKFIVKNKQIIGTTAKIKVANSFLHTIKKYKNFELKFEVKLDYPLNSGIQIRTLSKASDKYRIRGPQVEIADTGYAGYVYGESFGGWMNNKKEISKHKLFKKDKWNSYCIRAIGKTIETWINGKLITKLTNDKIPESGVIALQVHRIKNGSSKQVTWKNIMIKVLD